MGKIIEKDQPVSLKYDWKGELIALLIGAIIWASMVWVWVYWTDTQLGR